MRRLERKGGGRRWATDDLDNRMKHGSIKAQFELAAAGTAWLYQRSFMYVSNAVYSMHNSTLIVVKTIYLM